MTRAAFRVTATEPASAGPVEQQARTADVHAWRQPPAASLLIGLDARHCTAAYQTIRLLAG